MAPKFTWEEEMVQWMNMIMPHKNGFNHSVCPLTRVQCPMSLVCQTESTLFGKDILVC